MPTNRVKRIIAVFGGSTDEDVLDLAERLGSAIAAKNEIILTGGRPKDKDKIKYRAPYGAFNANSSSLWIGVKRTKEQPGAISPQTRGLLVASTLDHQRNYLEACMCDAAICLKGNEGTISEMTWALALQRPVALVGDRWKEICNLSGDPKVWMEYLINTTRALFKKSKGPEWIPEELFSEASLRARLQTLGKYKYYKSDVPAEDVIEWVRSQLPQPSPAARPESTASPTPAEPDAFTSRPAGPLSPPASADDQFPGYFPTVPGHDAAKKTYNQWIHLHAT